MNHLYYGDNLQILREHIKDESIDLIYLDPPFNSKRDYNLLFKSHKDMTVRRKSPRLEILEGSGRAGVR
jgi:16S rRNA G966 N2-methylase RsmD